MPNMEIPPQNNRKNVRPPLVIANGRVATWLYYRDLCFTKMDRSVPTAPLFTFKSSTNLLCFGKGLSATVISRSDLEQGKRRYVVAFSIRLPPSCELIFESCQRPAAARSVRLGQLPTVPLEPTLLPTHSSGRLCYDERRSPFFPDLH